MTRPQRIPSRERRRLRHRLRTEPPRPCASCRTHAGRTLVAGIVVCAACGTPSPEEP